MDAETYDTQPTAANWSTQNKIAIYARTGACKVELESQTDGSQLLGFDIAQRSGSGYDWKTKLRIRLSMDETVILATVLLGQSSTAKFTGHGVAHNKFMEVIDQPPNLLIRAFDPALSVTDSGNQRGGMRVIPVPPSRRFYLTALTVRALSLTTGLGEQAVLHLIDAQPMANTQSQTSQHADPRDVRPVRAAGA